MSKKNYIKPCNLFNTGFLANDTKIRNDQGLRQQLISNLCCKKCNTLYPLNSVPLIYDPTSAIPNNCYCTMYVQPP